MPAGLSEAIRRGAAPDGGLYVPAEAVKIEVEAIADDPSLAAVASVMLAPFFRGDPLEGELEAICKEALDLPSPLVAPDPDEPGLRLLELFHGPTGAFKDFGARFLMACLDRLGGAEAPFTVLAATSGDTGGAVGAAAEGKSSVRAVILYPPARVSKFQRLQLSCWTPPTLSLEVDGDFDDCQRLVKAAFADAALSARHRLTPGNSISVARLLAQMTYIGAAALELFRESGIAPGLVIPTGNLGHAVAALWAREAGMSIGPIVAATNANRTLHDWSTSGDYRPRPSVRTLATAMDVGAPSNFERLVDVHNDRSGFRVDSIEDEAIRPRIREEYRRTRYVLDPHGAIAVEAYRRLDPQSRVERPWIVAATAHPYKFAEIVEPLISEALAPPPALAAILDRQPHAQAIPATLKALVGALDRAASGVASERAAIHSRS
jgi:threonine synthase